MPDPQSRNFIAGMLLSLILSAGQGKSLSDEPVSGPAVPFELTRVDDKAIAYATFQSHNQKDVSNRHGIFITCIQSAAPDYLRQTWRLARSTDSGRSATEYTIETIAGSGQPGDTPENAPDARAVPVDLPFGVEYGPDGALYITAIGSHRVLRLDAATGQLTSVAGTGHKGYSGDGGPATQATFNEPYEVRFDSRGNMIIDDMRNHVLRRIDRGTGIITTIAGDGTLGDRGDGGPAVESRLHYPHSIALDAEDNIFIGDILNHRVRRIDARTGRIETVVGNGTEGLPLDGGLAREQPLTTPQGLAIHDGGLWLASFRLQRIWRVDLQTGVIRHIAGTGEQGHTGDGGDPLLATLDGPRGMKISPDGILYLLEGENNILRALDIRQRQIRTVAGAGPERHRFERDGVRATQAPLWQPHGVCVGADGTLVISDTMNHRVRKLVPMKNGRD